MNTYTRFITIFALSLLPVMGTSHAQNFNSNLGNNTTRQYDLSSLQSRPALLSLGKGDMLILDFPSDVDAIITPQINMVDIPDPMNNLAVVTGKVSSGTAQVMVKLTNGQYATFIMKLTPGGNGIKRIKINDATPIEYTMPTMPVGTNTMMPSYTAPQSNQEYTNQQTSSSTYPISNPLQLSHLAPITAPQPIWLQLQTSLSPSGKIFNVTLTNTGSRTITLNKNQLRVLSGVNEMSFSNVDNIVTLPAHSSKTIAITLNSPATDPLKVIWTAYDQQANANYTLEQ